MDSKTDEETGKQTWKTERITAKTDRMILMKDIHVPAPAIHLDCRCILLFRLDWTKRCVV